MGTNLDEGSEFINTYFSLELLVIIVLIIIVGFILYKCSSIIDFIGKKTAMFLFGFTLLSLSVHLYLDPNCEAYENRYFNKIGSFIRYENPPDLNQYRKELLLTYDNNKLPRYVILILGESFAKSHSSFYGYDKETNPNLKQIYNDKHLLVCYNAFAPATHTVACVKSVMSTFAERYANRMVWYECETIPNLMSSLGYKTYWISNQSPYGVYDNIGARYSELCDSVIWTGNRVKGNKKADHDGVIIETLENLDLSTVESNVCLIFHLMGSHNKYRDRYPVEYQKYSVEDYPELLEHQKQVIADYDNSILYNDYVVSQIFDRFSDKECVAYYFSDHGMDMFYTYDDYFGPSAGREIGLDIPYFIYYTSSFQKNFPKETEYLKNKVSSTIYTEDTIYDICNLLGVEGLECPESKNQ